MLGAVVLVTAVAYVFTPLTAAGEEGEPIAFIGKIESMSGKWDAVAHQHIVERVLLALCDEMTKLIDHPDIAEHSMGTAMMKLSNALADYRDPRWEDR